MVVLGAKIWHKHYETNPTALHRHNFQGPWYIFCANPLKTVLELLCFFRHMLSISHKLQHRKQIMIVHILVVPPHSIQVFTNVTRGFCLESVFHWFLFASHAVPHPHHVCRQFFALQTLNSSRLHKRNGSLLNSISSLCWLPVWVLCLFVKSVTRGTSEKNSVSYGPGALWKRRGELTMLSTTGRKHWTGSQAAANADWLLKEVGSR